MKNRPFNDGNKRTGFMLAAVFWETNDWMLTASEESVLVQRLALAARKTSEEEYAGWLRENSGKAALE